jgi:hypothetical protein
MTVSMTDRSSKIEVITSVQRRRRWSGLFALPHLILLPVASVRMLPALRRERYEATKVAGR